MSYALSLLLTIDGILHVLLLIAIVMFLMRLHRRHVV